MNNRLKKALNDLKELCVFRNQESLNYAFLCGMLIGIIDDLASDDQYIQELLIYKIEKITKKELNGENQ